MAQINEELIRTVFDEMIKHKASLSKMILTEEEDEEISDYRVLADLVIKNFPWPVGVELRRLFSGLMRQLDRMRLDQVFYPESWEFYLDDPGHREYVQRSEN
jgi:hypothetical protein